MFAEELGAALEDELIGASELDELAGLEVLEILEELEELSLELLVGLGAEELEIALDVGAGIYGVKEYSYSEEKVIFFAFLTMTKVSKKE